MVKETKMYREFANECVRIAELMSADDKAILLRMAKAWEDRAREAEQREAHDRPGPMRPMRYSSAPGTMGSASAALSTLGKSKRARAPFRTFQSR
jgi:hypothetical protein